MKIIIEVNEKLYRKAIFTAWNDYYDGDFKYADIKRLDNIEDFYRVIRFDYLNEEDIKSLKIKKEALNGKSINRRKVSNVSC